MARLRAVSATQPRAIGYVRVSMEGGRGDDLMSPDIQLTAIRDHCARRGYKLTEVLEDIDKTGRFWRRRKMETAVQMIEARTAEVVVVWKISRVSRNRKDWAVAVDRVEAAGGKLESATEPMDSTTSTGRFTRGMLAELAAFESERMGETWREVHQQRTTKGLPHSAPKRLGYAYTRSDGYEIGEYADVVHELYTRYPSQHAGVSGTAPLPQLNQSDVDLAGDTGKAKGRGRKLSEEQRIQQDEEAQRGDSEGPEFGA